MIVAGVPGAVDLSIANAAAVANRATDALADAVHASAKLPASAARTAELSGLPGLTSLAGLASLAVLRLLLPLARLAAVLSAALLTLALLALTRLRAWTITEAGELVAQARQVVHGAIDGSVAGGAFRAGAQGVGRVANLLAEFLQIAG